MYFTITTNRQVALAIELQCRYDAKMGHRSYKLGDVSHHENFSVVQIKPKNERIEPSDIFWLGHFSSVFLDIKESNRSTHNPDIIKDCVFSGDCFRKISPSDTSNSE